MYQYEILAPAGRPEAIAPLIDAGADAIYVGLSEFSSRPFSADFTIEEIKDAVKICHERNVALHIAINGCIRETKLDEIRSMLSDLDNIGVDAVILADWGLLSIAKSLIKHTPIHASTLLGTYNVETVRFLKQLGVSRVVMSTNIYIDEIATIINSVPDMEYEIVADGGICFNDNRICELPHKNDHQKYTVYCRLPYELKVDHQSKSANPIHADSICSNDVLLMYLQLGVYSFKIEGRTVDVKYIAPRVKRMKEAAERLKNKDSENYSALHYISRMRNHEKELL